KGISSGRHLVVSADCADPVYRAAPVDRRCADSGTSARCYRCHARGLRTVRATVEFCQYHCTSAAAVRRGRFQDLLHHCLAVGGDTNFLQSSLTRAILFSACTTAIAFGRLYFSHHPGRPSMGKLMGLSLLTTLAAAVIFQPALMATQRHKRLA